MKLDDLQKVAGELTDQQKLDITEIHTLYEESTKLRDKANRLRYKIQNELGLSGEDYSFLAMEFLRTNS